MKQWNIRTAILLATMLAGNAAFAGAAADTAGQLLAKLGKLAPEERQKRTGLCRPYGAVHIFETSPHAHAWG